MGFKSAVNLFLEEPFATFETNTCRSHEWCAKNQDCPSAAGVIGRNLEAFMTIEYKLSCEEVTTKTVLRLPSNSIISASPDKSTTKEVLHSNLRSYYDGDLNAVLPRYKDDFTSPYSPFFQKLLADKEDNKAIASFLQPSNYDIIIANITLLFELAMAHAFSDVFRPDPTTNWTAAAQENPAIDPQNLTSSRLRTTVSTNGTLINPNRYRLCQSPASSRVLEALLAAILICLATSWYLMPMHKKDKILPRNPCSIAAAGSLIAGSDMLEDLPSGVEWMDDEELERNRVWEGCIFRMGVYEKHDGNGGVETRFGVYIWRREEGDDEDSGNA